MIKLSFAAIIFSLIMFQPSPLMATVEELEEIHEADEFEAFRAVYVTIYYTHEEDLEKFFWRITEDEEINIYSYPGIAKSRIDRIVEKIQALLDMYPEKFHFNIYVHPRYDKGPLAFYTHKTNSITVYADNITEGVLAHEIGHALVRAYFKILPPKQIREIISQYLDEHLQRE